MIPRLSAKHPNESWYVGFDFTGALDAPGNPNSGETLSAVEEIKIVKESTGDDVTESIIA